MPWPSSSPPASPEAEAEAAEDWREGGFGVYVHWPFCAAKCPYCDFNSHVRAGIDHAAWARALVAEVRRVAAEVPGRRVGSVFFGGGTPSLMAPATVAAVLEAIDGAWGLAPGAEVTLEANPTSVEAGRFAGFAAAGVSRVSLGVQALRDDDLRRLGRLHTAADARAALGIARRHFARASVDLIYARPGQGVAAWEAELAEALALGVDHLSLYQLTIEEGTPFHALRARGRLPGLPDEGLAAGLFEATQALCAAAGLAAYEVSNHAAPGAESRHNLLYWRYGDFAGIGPGAHGRLTRGGIRRAVETERSPEAWLAAVAAGTGERGGEPLGRAVQAEEMLMMGLRLREGVRAGRFAALAGRPLDAGTIADLEAMGLLRRQGGQLAATDAGRLVLNAVLDRLLAAR